MPFVISWVVSAPATTALPTALGPEDAVCLAQLTSATYHILAAHFDAETLSGAGVALALLSEAIKAFLT